MLIIIRKATTLILIRMIQNKKKLTKSNISELHTRHANAKKYILLAVARSQYKLKPREN